MREPASLIGSLHTTARPFLDGDSVVFEVSRPDTASDSYTTRLHAVPLAGDGPVRRVSAGWSDRAAAHAGGTRAHLSAPAGAPAQLWVGLGGGAPRAVTEEPLGVQEFALSEDGQEALVIARDPEPGRYGTDPDVGPEAEAPRRIVAAQYQMNGIGYVLDRPARLLRVQLAHEADAAVAGEIPLPEAVEALRVPGDAHEPRAQHGRVSVLGRVTEPGPRPDLRSTVWIEDTDGPVALDLGNLSVSSHAWLDADRLLVLASDLGETGTDFVAKITGLHLHDVRDGSTVRLTPEDRWELGGDLRVVAGRAHCLATADGAERLVRIALSETPGETAVEPLTPADWVVSHYDADEAGTVVVTAATPASTGEVFRLDASGPVALTALETTDWYEAAPVTATTSGGEVHGWCALPAGEGPHPVVLLIHGGPFAQYTAAVLDEIQVLLDAGIAVVWSNPRGSAGRGRDWGLAVQGDFAEPAAEDVLAILDAALAAHPQLDAARQGVAGGSYGGYLTAMIIASHHRFAAAIVERGFLDPVAFAGTSDIGSYFGLEYVGEDPAAVARQSPLARVADVRTPTLVLHSERDLRCPLEQAQQYFAGLLRAGTQAEMLVFPGEDHELSRSGRPRHRVARSEAIVAWFGARLGAGTQDADDRG